MIIVKITGGLGNQMFQYALYRSLLSRGKNVKLDVSDYKYHKYWYGYQLKDAFYICERIASEDECRVLRKINYRGYSDWDKANIIEGRGNHIVEWKLYKNSFLRYQQYYEEIFNLDNVYLEGFWQSWKYFDDIRSVLLEEFRPKKILNKRNLEYKKQILSTMSISIHVRRSDYVNTDLDTVTEEYYRLATQYFTERYTDPYFYIFSDDIEWCKERLQIKNFIFIMGNEGRNNIFDMHLMSLCQKNIIANSSFSWWAAYLNINENKEVIFPKQWNSNLNITNVDYIYPGWIGK